MLLLKIMNIMVVVVTALRIQARRHDPIADYFPIITHQQTLQHLVTGFFFFFFKEWCTSMHFVCHGHSKIVKKAYFLPLFKNCSRPDCLRDYPRGSRSGLCKSTVCSRESLVPLRTPILPQISCTGSARVCACAYSPRETGVVHLLFVFCIFFFGYWRLRWNTKEEKLSCGKSILFSVFAWSGLCGAKKLPKVYESGFNQTLFPVFVPTLFSLFGTYNGSFGPLQVITGKALKILKTSKHKQTCQSYKSLKYRFDFN